MENSRRIEAVDSIKAQLAEDAKRVDYSSQKSTPHLMESLKGTSWGRYQIDSLIIFMNEFNDQEKFYILMCMARSIISVIASHKYKYLHGYEVEDIRTYFSALLAHLKLKLDIYDMMEKKLFDYVIMHTQLYMGMMLARSESQVTPLRIRHKNSNEWNLTPFSPHIHKTLLNTKGGDHDELTIELKKITTGEIVEHTLTRLEWWEIVDVARSTRTKTLTVLSYYAPEEGVNPESELLNPEEELVNSQGKLLLHHLVSTAKAEVVSSMEGVRGRKTKHGVRLNPSDLLDAIINERLIVTRGRKKTSLNDLGNRFWCSGEAVRRVEQKLTTEMKNIESKLNDESESVLQYL